MIGKIAFGIAFAIILVGFIYYKNKADELERLLYVHRNNITNSNKIIMELNDIIKTKENDNIIQRNSYLKAFWHYVDIIRAYKLQIEFLNKRLKILKKKYGIAKKINPNLEREVENVCRLPFLKQLWFFKDSKPCASLEGVLRELLDDCRTGAFAEDDLTYSMLYADLELCYYYCRYEETKECADIIIQQFEELISYHCISGRRDLKIFFEGLDQDIKDLVPDYLVKRLFEAIDSEPKAEFESESKDDEAENKLETEDDEAEDKLEAEDESETESTE